VNKIDVPVVAMDLEISNEFPDPRQVESQIAELQCLGGLPENIKAKKDLLACLNEYRLLDWTADHPDGRLGVSCIGYWSSQEGLVHGSVCGVLGEDGLYANRMPEEQINAEIDRMHRWYEDGIFIVTWNGLGFDFRVLHQETTSPEHRAKCRFLAQRHIDLCFLFLCYKGYPAKLDVVNKCMGFAGKTEGMDGALAPAMWRRSAEDQEKVLKYVARDAQATLELYQAAYEIGGLKHQTSSGQSRFCQFDPPTGHRLQTCWDAIEQVKKPNMSWWKRGTPPSREKSYGWTRTASQR
jgi:hypothetical protein